MTKDKLVNLLTISFEICESNPLSKSSHPYLIFKRSNHDLSDNEILRAKLSPNKLILDNQVVYVKKTENAYLNRSGKNMLKTDYIRGF